MGNLTIYLGALLFCLLALIYTFDISSTLSTSYSTVQAIQKSPTTRTFLGIFLVSLCIFFIYSFISKPQSKRSSKVYAQRINPHDYQNQASEYTKEKLNELYSSPEFQTFMAQKRNARPSEEPLYELSDDELSD
ncbi:unnamed protein product [Blepharisma stoltei]|uniref:Uncharacterized protein n=1 Tax=Blepharisma stoltei TaxID=1481888 RepID=A0AAU9IRC7_9CILI|nr:unnamed protein product [Blepharisma stoltei]